MQQFEVNVIVIFRKTNGTIFGCFKGIAFILEYIFIEFNRTSYNECEQGFIRIVRTHKNMSSSTNFYFKYNEIKGKFCIFSRTLRFNKIVFLNHITIYGQRGEGRKKRYRKILIFLKDRKLIINSILSTREVYSNS